MILRRIVSASKDAEIHRLVRQVAQEIFVADDLAEALDITNTVNPDLVVFDRQFGLAHICEFLDKARKNSINVPIVAIGNDEDDLSEEFVRTGVYGYLCGKKDYGRLEQIANSIKNSSEAVIAERNFSDFFVEDCAASAFIVGRSKAIAETIRMIKLVAASRCDPVLIVGETGTGKELAAKAVHNLRHPNEQFIAINCAALTATLLESELFGHVKGSFTGADSEKTGLLEQAGCGTLFLDEISEMPVELQAKLLRVLQEKTFRKVGGTEDTICNATIIASSNRNLYEEVQSRRFRRDLYYRLNICPITIAPLRTAGRREDIPLLAEYFLKTSSICPQKSIKTTSLTKLALEALQKHNWPGNVRELQNVIERAILIETTDKIGLSSIVIDPFQSAELPDGHPTGQIRDFSLAKAERELIARALQQTGWQKTQAATLLGITRATLYAKVKQYNIWRQPPPSGEKEFHNAEKLRNEAADSTGPLREESLVSGSAAIQ
jgi:DNA-binding NtrC family response regulator